MIKSPYKSIINRLNKKKPLNESARHAKKAIQKSAAGKISFSNIVLALTMIFLFMPLVVIAIYSFNPGKGSEITGFSLIWYEKLLFDSSEESPGVEGLGLIKGRITKIPNEYTAEDGTKVFQKVPQIGWNDLKINPKSRLFAGITGNPYVYFVHSYFLTADNPEEVAASTYYGTEIHAAVEKGNIFATQFHPEKSSEVGLKILQNFINL